jgi:hypothetical protein
MTARSRHPSQAEGTAENSAHRSDRHGGEDVARRAAELDSLFATVLVDVRFEGAFGLALCRQRIRALLKDFL